MPQQINTPPAQTPGDFIESPAAFDASKLEWYRWFQAAAPQFGTLTAEAQAAALAAAASVLTAAQKVIEAEAQKAAAAGHATAAAGHATTASGHATAAAGHVASAAAHVVAAGSHATAAAGHASAAATAQGGSEAARNKAQAWADAAPGVPVDGGYSARHWAQAAQNAASGQLTYMGGCDLSAGSYPANPERGDYWRVAIGGIVGGLEVLAGDSIIYNGTSWDKIDNTERVGSVAGRIGDVVLTKHDVGLGNVDNLSAAQIQADMAFNGRHVSGAWDFSSDQLRLSGHAYRHTHDGFNVYDHYGPGDGRATSANLRVYTTGNAGVKVLQFDGHGGLRWDGFDVLHTGNSAASGVDMSGQDWLHSGRDFTHGTLVQTSIDYSGWAGEPWVLEVRGNSYGLMTPMDVQVQGYIYNGTCIHVGGISNGQPINGMVALLHNGKLCFWWPRQAYWSGYNVRVYVPYAGVQRNKVTSITDAAQPGSAKLVDLSGVTQQSLHSSNHLNYVAKAWNNGGNPHVAHQSFASVSDFGPFFVQSSPDGPTGGQYYGLSLGLGSDYVHGTHGMEIAIPRTPANGGGRPYINLRYREAGAQQGWQKAAAGYADSAGSLTTLDITDASNGVAGAATVRSQIGYTHGLPTMFGWSDGGLYTATYSPDWQHQIFGDFRSGQMAVRGKRGDGGGWQPWRTVLDSGNFGEFALPKVGGTVTGDLAIDGNASVRGRDLSRFEHNSFIEFWVDGDANTYYPVLLGNWGIFHFGSWSISRGYSDGAPWDAVGQPGSVSGYHHAGLTLTWEWSGDSAWGGNDHSYRVIQFDETYRNTVAGMVLSVNGMIVWLRGGHAYYRFHGPGGLFNTAVPHYSAYTASNGAVFSPRTDVSNVPVEIHSRWPVRENSALFENNHKVLNAGNLEQYTARRRTDNGYLEPETWIMLNGYYGMFSPVNNAHFFPNNATYGSWRVSGTRNGWAGLSFDEANTTLMFSPSGHAWGVHNDTNGWQTHWYQGTLYVGKGTYGGSLATVLDTSNFPNWAQPLLVPGTNIKTVNGQSLMGSGDLSVVGGGGPAFSAF